MNRRRSALLWGAVGALVVAVLGVALPVLGPERPAWPLLAGTALVTGIVAGSVSYALEHRLVVRGRR